MEKEEEEDEEEEAIIGGPIVRLLTCLINFFPMSKKKEKWRPILGQSAEN